MISTNRLISPSRTNWNVVDKRARQARDDPRHDDQRDAVADSALGDLLADPHHEHRARGDREHGDDAEAPARSVDHRAAARRLDVLERDRDHEALHHRQHHRAVARVLADLAPPRLAFLVQFVEVGPRDLEQVQDDRDRDVGHDAQREDRKPLQRAAREQIDPAEQRARSRVEERGERLPVDSRRGHGYADAVHDQHHGRKPQPSAQLGDARGV